MSAQLAPTGTCWCGCGEQPNPGSFFLAGHDRVAEAAVILNEYGSVPAFLQAHGYGPGGRNSRQILAQLQREVPAKYQPLADYLAGQQGQQVTCTMVAIEGALGTPLPPAARTHRAWWGNNTQRHPQAKAWLNTGWRVHTVNLKQGAVTFVHA